MNQPKKLTLELKNWAICPLVCELVGLHTEIASSPKVVKPGIPFAYTQAGDGAIVRLTR